MSFEDDADLPYKAEEAEPPRHAQSTATPTTTKQRLLNRRSRAVTTEIYLSPNRTLTSVNNAEQRGIVANRDAPAASSIIRISTEHTALAEALLERYCRASTQQAALSCFNKICALLKLRPSDYSTFYPRLKQRLQSWRAKSLWTKFDRKFAQKEYSRNGAKCLGLRVLIVGGGPCGLRMSIEAALLGCKVVVVEKRDRVSRNNVLHLWPFVIADLKQLGAKKFCLRFCSGAIDHISIRQLQLILLKAALLLGVEFRQCVAYEELVEPSSMPNGHGWRARFSPASHCLNQYEFDVLIGADGKRNTLSRYFTRKEFRGKLAIGITINFVNMHTQREQRVAEISGVAFIFNQQFFCNMREQTGIDLENIVYYKNDTHYFVMTAKKLSLLEQGVLKHDRADTIALLSPENVNQTALLDYARRAAAFATNNELAHAEFSVNHYGEPDVAMFDFTSMFQAEHACRIVERSGHSLLMSLVGDSLLEPFWPMGTGAGRGFLACQDTAWMMRSYASGRMTPLQILAERETTYRLLAQTTQDNISKRIHHYTIDPQSRYPTLNAHLIKPAHVLGLYDSDSMRAPDMSELSAQTGRKMRTYNNSVASPSSLSGRTRRSRISSAPTFSGTTNSQQFEWNTLLDWLQESYDELCSSNGAEQKQSSSATVVEIGGDAERSVSRSATAYPSDAFRPKTLSENDLTARLLLQCVVGRYRPEFMSGFEAAIDRETEDNCAKFLALLCIHELGFAVRSASVYHHSRNGSGVSSVNLDSNDENTAPAHPNSAQSVTGIDLKFMLSQMYSAFRWEQVLSTGDKTNEATQLQRHFGIDDAELWADYEQLIVRRQQEQQNNLHETLRTRNVIPTNYNKRKSPSLYSARAVDEDDDAAVEEAENEFVINTTASSPTSNLSMPRSEHISSKRAAPRRSECLENVNISERRKLLVESLAGTMHDASAMNGGQQQRRRSRQPQIKRKNSATDKRSAVTVTHSYSVDPAMTNAQKLDLDRVHEQLIKSKHVVSSGSEKPHVMNAEVFEKKRDAVKSRMLANAADEEDTPSSAFEKKLKRIEQQLNGELLEPGVRGNNRVAAMTNTYVNKISVDGVASPVQNEMPVKQKKVMQPSAGDVVTIVTGGESCFFCHRRVYVVERHAAEGLMFHRSCFKCAACGMSLRPNAYAYNKLEQRFYCLAQHAHLAEVTAATLARMEEENRLHFVAPAELQQPTSFDENDKLSDTTITDEEDADSDLAAKTPERAGFELRQVLNSTTDGDVTISNHNASMDDEFVEESDVFTSVLPGRSKQSPPFSKSASSTSLRRSQSAVDERSRAAILAARAAVRNGVTVSGGSRAAQRRVENDTDFYAVEGAEPLDKRGWHKLGDNYFYRAVPKADEQVATSHVTVDLGKSSTNILRNTDRSPLFAAKQVAFLSKNSPARQPIFAERPQGESSSTSSASSSEDELSDDDGRRAVNQHGSENEELYYSGRETVEHNEEENEGSGEDEELAGDGYAYYAPSVSPPDFVRNSPDAFYRREDFPPSPPELVLGTEKRRASTPDAFKTATNKAGYDNPNYPEAVAMKSAEDAAVQNKKADTGNQPTAMQMLLVRMKKSNSDHHEQMLQPDKSIDNITRVAVDGGGCYNSLPEFPAVSARAGTTKSHQHNKLLSPLVTVQRQMSSIAPDFDDAPENTAVVASPTQKPTITATVSFNQQNLQPSVVTVLSRADDAVNFSPRTVTVNSVQRTISAPLSTATSTPIKLVPLIEQQQNVVVKIVASSPPPATSIPSRPADVDREPASQSPALLSPQARREVISPSVSSVTSSSQGGSGARTHSATKTLRETNGIWDPSVVETSKRLREMRARSRQSYDHDEPGANHSARTSSIFSPSPWETSTTSVGSRDEERRRQLSPVAVPVAPSSLDLNVRSKNAAETPSKQSMLYFDQLRTPLAASSKPLSAAVDGSFHKVPSKFGDNDDVFYTPRDKPNAVYFPPDENENPKFRNSQQQQQNVYYTAVQQQPARERFYTAQQSRIADDAEDTENYLPTLARRRRSQSSSNHDDYGAKKNFTDDLTAAAGGCGNVNQNSDSNSGQLLWKDELVRQHEEARQRARERARLKSDAEMLLRNGSSSNGSVPPTPRTPLVSIRPNYDGNKSTSNSMFYVENDRNHDVVTIRPAPGDSSQMRTRFQQHMTAQFSSNTQLPYQRDHSPMPAASHSAVLLRKRDASNNNNASSGEQQKKQHKDQQHHHEQSDSNNSQEKRRSLLDIFKSFGRSAAPQTPTAVVSNKPAHASDIKQRQMPVIASGKNSGSNFYYDTADKSNHHYQQKEYLRGKSKGDGNENLYAEPPTKITVVPTISALTTTNRSSPHAGSESGATSTSINNRISGVSSPEAQNKELRQEQLLYERELGEIQARIDTLDRDGCDTERRLEKRRTLRERAKVLQIRLERIEVLKETNRTRRKLRELLLLDEGAPKSRVHIEQENSLLERLLELRKQLNDVESNLAD